MNLTKNSRAKASVHSHARDCYLTQNDNRRHCLRPSYSVSFADLRTISLAQTMFRYLLLSAVAVLLSACGGGGNGASIGGGGPGPGGGGASWQPGVFQPADNFFARCEAPRSGNNPATGRSYPDIQGTVLDENNFLRSLTDEVYLWYDEVADRDPGLYADPLGYFDLLVTNELSPSGQPKDKFHFTYDSQEWFELSQTGVSAGYGAQFVLLSATPPRQVVVAYTDPNTPATSPQVNLARGAEILTIDGVDVIFGNDIDTLNDGLFPLPGETHTFEVRDLGAQNTRMVTMTAASITSTPVQNVSVLDTPTGRVGYLVFNDHIATAEDGLIDAVNQLNAGEGIDDLVLDIRYNGGGFLDIAAEAAFMIAGSANIGGRSFETLQFNDKHPTTNPFTGLPLMPTPFHNRTQGFGDRPINEALPSLNLSRVFVLTGPGTCSASEAIMNGLRGIGVEVIQIGSTTCGKPYGFYPIDNCGTTYFTIQFRGVNDMGFGDYSDGFSPANTQGTAGVSVPGCSVADDFTAQLGDPAEARLATALAYRDNGTCPAPTAFAVQGASKPAGALAAVDGITPKNIFKTNRIMRR